MNKLLEEDQDFLKNLDRTQIKNMSKMIEVDPDSFKEELTKYLSQYSEEISSLEDVVNVLFNEMLKDFYIEPFLLLLLTDIEKKLMPFYKKCEFKKMNRTLSKDAVKNAFIDYSNIQFSEICKIMNIKCKNFNSKLFKSIVAIAYTKLNLV